MKLKKKNLEIIILVILSVTLIVGICLFECINQEFDIASADNEKYAAELSEVTENLKYDKLTGCLNYDAYKDKLNSFISECRGSNDGTQVVQIRVGFGHSNLGLKYINDNFGHFNGDSAIVDFAKILKEIFSEQQFSICHSDGSAFLICGKGKFTQEILCNYYNKLKERWHDTPYKIHDGSGEVEGMALIYLSALYPNAGNDLNELEKQIENRKQELKKYTSCGYVLIMDKDKVVSSEPSIK